MGIFDFFNKKEKKEVLDAGLEKTKRSVFEKISHAIAGKSTIDDEVLDNLEEVLATSDVGVDTTIEIINRIEERVFDEISVEREKYNIFSTICNKEELDETSESFYPMIEDDVLEIKYDVESIRKALSNKEEIFL